MRSTSALVTYLEGRIETLSVDIKAMKSQKKKNEYQKGFIAAEELELSVFNDHLKDLQAIQPKRKAKRKPS